MSRQVTSQLPAELEFLHTYSGSAAFPPHPPIYTPDAMRCRPTLVFGADASAKKEMLITQAYMDACKDRPVFFIDGSPNPGGRILDKLFYWNHVLAKKPFYALLPSRDMDYLCHTWNPFAFPEKNIDALTAILFDGFLASKDVSGKTPPGAATEHQRKILFELIRALHHSGRAFCFNDIRAILESPEIRVHVARILDEKNGAEYRAWLASAGAEGRAFETDARPIADYLNHFSLWSLNSYHPQISLPRMIETSATVYIGLPVDSNPAVMSCLGKMLVHQLIALATDQPDGEPMDRPPFAVTIDPAHYFLDAHSGDRIYALRPSSIMLSLGFRNLAEMAGIGPKFQTDIRLNAANLFMFNPNCVETANWFSEFSQADKIDPALVPENGGEKAAIPLPKINEEIEPASVHDLPGGQCYYWPSHGLAQPVKLQAPFLFDPPPLPQCRFHRLPYAAPRDKKGLNLWSVQLPSASAEKVTTS